MSQRKRQLRTRRNWKTGRLIRNEYRNEPDDDRLSRHSRDSGTLAPWDLILLEDWDYQYFRARRTSGWKNSRCRRQWEKRVRAEEKRLKNRKYQT